MSWFKDRFRDRTAWLALAGTMQFIGLMTKSEELPQMAEAVAQNAGALASGDYIGASINIATLAAVAFGLKRVK